jgi:signal transduction histidine kinase
MDPLVLYGAVFALLMLTVAMGVAAYITWTESRKQSGLDAEELIDAVDEPLVVLDADGTVLTANVAFRSLFEREPADDDIADVLSGHPEVLATLDSETRATVPVRTETGTRHFDVRHRPFGKGIREDRKRLVLFEDVTDRRNHQRELEHQNDRLDEFASIISHDLRNPLDVALGRATAVREELDDEQLVAHIERMQDAHGRMEQIITDVLALAREGGEIETTESVPLEVVADDAWAHVDTGRASLEVETELAVEADRDRLTRVFENLFRNSIEHGVTETDSPDRGEITVRVGELDDSEGFFVADDGTGIPVTERETVFETGYTSGGASTGLGLAIVARIAHAHGWEVRATESETGGARFEFTGVGAAANEFATPAN